MCQSICIHNNHEPYGTAPKLYQAFLGINLSFQSVELMIDAAEDTLLAVSASIKLLILASFAPVI